MRFGWARQGAIVLSAVLLAALAGCGSGSSTQPPAAEGPHIDVQIELADCTDWNDAAVEERLGTLRQLKEFAGGPVVGGGANPATGTGAVLEDKPAYDFLTDTCKQSYARGFKLYKIYERAASFAGQPGSD
jgi:hypothetical protein